MVWLVIWNFAPFDRLRMRSSIRELCSHFRSAFQERRNRFMRVREIMTENPVYGLRETNLQEIAQMMVEYDCGSIPVVENQKSLRPIGVVTDRDIVCRIVAEG